ncbi:hypothetical protein CCAX7_000660 [Capsulimonas corticalis]|uniref:Uncharacterized protein n=1 Tax=Capsulimonas corticalis TaxID=2219043 RepID=A0A402CRP7_9BACT|nr:hypothetical protein [Capsulimonas corticalis]BDI28015.1 hypothetical protein CCAX7_000660 [Capsulimonas corticalis]
MGQLLRVTLSTADGRLIMESSGPGERIIHDRLEYDIALACELFAARGIRFTAEDRAIMTRNFEERQAKLAKAEKAQKARDAALARHSSGAPTAPERRFRRRGR